MMASVTGLGDLRIQFQKLQSDMRLKTSRRMVASGGRVLRKEAKTLAKGFGLKKSGALIRNIAIKRERNAPPGTEQYNLGVRHGRNLGNGKRVVKFLAVDKRSGRVVTKRQNDPFYWRFLEFDTSSRKGTSFIEQSFKNKRTQAAGAMGEQLTKDLAKAGK